MPSLYYDMDVTQNEDTSVQFTWKPGGVVANLTGYTALMKVRATPSVASPSVLTLTDASGISLGGAAGTIRVSITATQAAGISPGRYVYNLLLIDTLGVKHVLLDGVFTAHFGSSQ